MQVVRTIGTILLAVYLIFSGLSTFMGITFPELIESLLGLTGVGAGVLLLISLGKGNKK